MQKMVVHVMYTISVKGFSRQIDRYDEYVHFKKKKIMIEDERK